MTVVSRNTFTVGMEEEYFLIDPTTREWLSDPPRSFRKDYEEALGDQVTGELIRSQIEVATGVCTSAKPLRGACKRIDDAVVIGVLRHSTWPGAGTESRPASGFLTTLWH